MRKLVSTLVVQMGDFQKKIAPPAPDKRMDAQDVCDGLMPKHFLKSFQQHPLEYGQNGKCVASDVRGDLAPELHFLPMIPRLSRMALYSPTGKTHSGSLSFHPYPYIFQSVR